MNSCKEYRPTPSLLQVTQNMCFVYYTHKMWIFSFINEILSRLHALYFQMWFILIEWFEGLWITYIVWEVFSNIALFEPDVVYDPDIIACLVKLLSRLLNCKVQENHPDVYIASTVRNPQTYDCFKEELGRFHTYFSIPLHYWFKTFSLFLILHNKWNISFIYRKGWPETCHHERFCCSSISIQPSLHYRNDQNICMTKTISL